MGIKTRYKFNDFVTFSVNIFYFARIIKSDTLQSVDLAETSQHFGASNARQDKTFQDLFSPF